MVKSKPKKEKKEETTAEFVARMNHTEAQKKRNGLKRNVKGARRYLESEYNVRIFFNCSRIVSSSISTP